MRTRAALRMERIAGRAVLAVARRVGSMLLKRVLSSRSASRLSTGRISAANGRALQIERRNLIEFGCDALSMCEVSHGFRQAYPRV